jgi:hypothetical protein
LRSRTRGPKPDRCPTRARRVPALTEEVQIPGRRRSFGVGDRGHPLQRDNHLGLSRIHIHLPDPGLAGGKFFLIGMLYADIFGSVEEVHPLEVVGQCRRRRATGQIEGKVRPRPYGSWRAYKPLAVVRPVVHDLVGSGRAGASCASSRPWSHRSSSICIRLEII